MNSTHHFKSPPGAALRFLALFILVLSCRTAPNTFGQASEELMSQMSHKAWGAKDGIVDVQAITQTKDGYLWIGTDDGLFRFDGLTFVRWTAIEELGASPGVTVLCAGRDGSLWIGTGTGVSRLRNGRLTNFTATSGLAPSEVTSILEDRKGIIWVATTKGLAGFVDEKWVVMGKDQGLPEGKKCVELQDQKGNLWVAVDDPAVAGGTVLGVLSLGKDHFEQGSEHLGSVAMLRESPNGTVWIAESSQSVRPLPVGKNKETVRGFPVQSKAILFDRQGTFWISTIGHGIFRIPNSQLNAKELELPHDKFTEKEGLSGDVVCCAFEDREGNIWFGTTGGLDCFHANRIASFSVAEGLQYDQKLMVAATADGAIWTGSELGLQRLHGQKVETLGLEWIGPGWANGVYSFFASDSGELWMGALNGVGHIQGSVPTSVPIPGGMELHNVTAITRDLEGGLWLCDQLRGVCRLRNNNLRVFPAGPLLSSATVNAAMTDKTGSIWFGHQDGTVSLFREGRFRSFSIPQSVMALHCDRRGRIWAAGLGGLSRLTNDHFQTLTMQNGLASAKLSGIVEDNNGLIWLAGGTAIMRIDPKELDAAFADPNHRIHCDLYGFADGMRGFPRQGRPLPVATKTQDGRLWFATTAGLSVINPLQLQKNTNTPPVHIMRAVADGRSLQTTPKLQLPARTRDIKIDYTALSFADPERIQFRCQLSGYEDHWRDVNSLRQVSYANLGPGDYVFHVTACNNDGIWDPTGASWEFSIRAAFYQTSWFLILSVAASAGLLWCLYRWNLSRATALTTARLNARMEAQLSERKRISQELHDTLLQGFIGVRFKLWAIAHQLPKSSAAAREQLTKVIQQTDECLTESRNSVWAMRSQRLEQTDLTSVLSQAVKQLVADTHLRSDFQIAGVPRRLDETVEFNLLRICVEAVTNVIKHAEAKKVTVTLTFEAHEVVLQVNDDGHGFDPDSKNNLRADHFGLSGMRDRATSAGGTLTVASKPGDHTKITVTLIA